MSHTMTRRKLLKGLAATVTGATILPNISATETTKENVATAVSEGGFPAESVTDLSEYEHTKVNGYVHPPYEMPLNPNVGDLYFTDGGMYAFFSGRWVPLSV